MTVGDRAGDSDGDNSGDIPICQAEDRDCAITMHAMTMQFDHTFKKKYNTLSGCRRIKDILPYR